MVDLVPEQQHPTRKGEFYVITDRGPNVAYSNGKKILVPNLLLLLCILKLMQKGKLK
jgi:hypothetical protein